jgi:predicted nucleic acid-binding protein
MSTYYLDTSAAVKLYVSEVESDWLRLLLPANQSSIIVSSHLLRVEMWSAFTRRLREGSVTPNEHTRMHERPHSTETTHSSPCKPHSTSSRIKCSINSVW